MTVDDIRTELDRLANEAAGAMGTPHISLPLFARAHALAISLGDRKTAAILSYLMARCASRGRKEFARALKFARRAVAEDPHEMSFLRTLADLLEMAASRQQAGSKSRRAMTLYLAAAAIFVQAADQSPDPNLSAPLLERAVRLTKFARGGGA